MACRALSVFHSSTETLFSEDVKMTLFGLYPFFNRWKILAGYRGELLLCKVLGVVFRQ
jgi:hypothetical protein